MFVVVRVWMGSGSHGMSARRSMMQLGRRILLPTAQSGRRSSARGLLCPLCACWVRAGLDSPYTKLAIPCTAPFRNPVPYTKLAILCTALFGNPVPYTKLAIPCTAFFENPVPYTKSVILCTAIKIMMRTARKRGLILAVGGGFDVVARKRGLILAVEGGFDVVARKRGLILAVGGGFDVAARKRGLILAV